MLSLDRRISSNGIFVHRLERNVANVTRVVPSLLIVASRINTDEKPYRCETCDAMFSQICSLNVHEISMQDSNMPFNYTEHEATRTLGGHGLIEVEQGMKTDPDECGGNREVAAVFPGGVLKDAKSEHDGLTLDGELARRWVVCPGVVLI